MTDESQLDIDIDINSSETIAMPATHHNMPTHHTAIAPSKSPQIAQQGKAEHTVNLVIGDLQHRVFSLERSQRGLTILVCILLAIVVEELALFAYLLGHIR